MCIRDRNNTLNFEAASTIDIDVTVTDAEGLFYTETLTVQIGDANDAPTGSVDISDLTPAQGDVLTASNTLMDEDGISGAITYQWLRDGVPITGAAGPTYTVTQDDVGAVLTSVASYTDDRGTAESVTSTPTGLVANVNDAVVGQPVILGTPTEDEVLSIDTSGISDIDGLGTFSYQFFRDGVPISGATGATYTLSDADVGTTTTVEVSYTDAHGTAESTLSAGVGPIANVNDAVVGQPVILGTPTEDEILSVDTSGISDIDGLGTFSYQFFRDGVPISGATGATYTLTDADVGTTTTVEVSYTDA